MKKVFLAFAVASIFAACSDSATKTETKTDSTGVVKDSAGAVTPPVAPDSMVIKTDSAGKMSVDTSKKK